ncbi:hypothetical protein DSO57_1006947 [Entomophthora muscae]|uniref:Uncharacterized protein n=1 Tax=Entomophthora muscae TaxID=34485 RepID=A0ACC2SWN9_9FUNG|nr:hypothetical protein DSO57_1006947 [Entomophthora muscae]
MLIDLPSMRGFPIIFPDSIRCMTCKTCRRLGGGVEVMHVFSDLLTRGRAVLMLDKHRNEIVLTFRGSLFLENWISNIQFFMTSAPYAKGVRVHGFKHAAGVLLDDIIPPLRKALDQYLGYKLIVTGHSLGGSLATLTVSELLYREIVDPSRLHVFSYGEPRTGNAAFTRWYNSRPIRMTRVVNENDIVPHILPALFGFVHHSTESFIQNNQSSTCSSSSLESLQCSLSRFPFLSILNHLRAWDLPLGITAC